MKIVINNLSGSANELKNYISKISNDINKMKNIIDSEFSVAWQGEDATSFKNEYNNIINKLLEYKTSLDDYYKFLSEVKRCFDLLEEGYQKPIV